MLNIASSELGAHLCLLCVQTVQVTEAIKEAKDAKKEAVVELEKGADTVVRSTASVLHSAALGLPSLQKLVLQPRCTYWLLLLAD